MHNESLNLRNRSEIKDIGIERFEPPLSALASD